jgi:3-oxoacyl-[acyl-carrier protein] reductase
LEISIGSRSTDGGNSLGRRAYRSFRLGRRFLASAREARYHPGQRNARGLSHATQRQDRPHNARGANVALVDRDAAGLDVVRRACESHGVRAVPYGANVAAEADVIRTFDRVVADFGRLDAMIANAGILRDGLLVKAKDGQVVGKLSLADWQAVIDVNLTGVFLCGREAAERMIRLGNGGCIVNIASLSRAGNFGQSNYSAAKAGVTALTVVWAKELARFGVRVNAIAPGFIKTEMVASMKPEMLDKMAAAIPLQRLGTPDEIAHAAVFLLENDYVNGRVVEIDGGLRL